MTQYDKMQRAFVGASPQLRFISSFCFEVLIIRYLYLLCGCVWVLYDDVLFKIVTDAYNLKIEYILFLHAKTIWAKCNLKVEFMNSWIYNKKVIIQLTVQYRLYLDSYPDNWDHLSTCPNIFRHCIINCIIKNWMRTCMRSCDMTYLVTWQLQLVNLQASTIAVISHERKKVGNQYLYLHFTTPSM